MIAFPTAKVLLFLALNLGPQNPPTIYVTSQSESYVYTQEKSGWTVVAKGFPASDFTREPDQSQSGWGEPAGSSVPAYLRAVSHYQWSHDNAMVFDNGDRVEKHGKYGLYIINAGGPNEKVFTILYPTSTDPQCFVEKQEK